MEIFGHCAHDVEAFLYFQGFCSSKENDFSRSDGNLLPTPDTGSLELHWLGVIYLSPCEDTCLDLVYHLMHVHPSKFTSKSKTSSYLDIGMFPIPFASVSAKFDPIACVEHSSMV